jgi:hypothetical protein
MGWPGGWVCAEAWTPIAKIAPASSVVNVVNLHNVFIFTSP